MNWGTEPGTDDEQYRKAGESGPHDEEPVLVDIHELNTDWSQWLPGVDYVATARETKAGEAALRSILRRVHHCGSRMRVQRLSTREGEPVVRLDLHPDGWREVAELVADGERFRQPEKTSGAES